MLHLPSLIDRRRFLQLMGASIALAGLGACTRLPKEKIFSFVRETEEGVTDQDLVFATVASLGGDARGILVKSHEGRPIKIDGNPDHPASLGGSDAFLQADLLSLYDPERLKAPALGNNLSSWDSFLADVFGRIPRWKNTRGAGLRILSGEIQSPTLISEMNRLIALYPEARWHSYEPFSLQAIDSGSEIAFSGNTLRPIYHLAKADLVVSLDSDFLFSEPRSLVMAREFMDGRRVRDSNRKMNRLLVAESSLSLTGAIADSRWAFSPADLLRLIQELASEFGLSEKKPGSAAGKTIAKELKNNPGKSVLLVGRQQSPAVHALAHAINERLENFGNTVELVPHEPSGASSVSELINDIHHGQVQELILLGGNPVYDAPSDLHVAEALKKVSWKVRLSTHLDETASVCDWRIPESHFLEAWGDARSYDGTVTLQQPLIDPLYPSKTAIELISSLRGDATESPHHLLKSQWERSGNWDSILRRGVAAERSESKNSKARVDARAVSDAIGRLSSSSGLTLVFRPDASVWDGRYANNAWLQELPRPFSKLTWDNALWIGEKTARDLGLSTGDVVEISSQKREAVLAPILVQELHPEQTLTAPLGYGRTLAGSIGNGVGFNAYPLRTTTSMNELHEVSIRKTDRHHDFAFTQHHSQMESEDPVRTESLTHLKTKKKAVPSILPEGPPIPASTEYAWAMVIDLNACIGCSACTIACQAENNIPIVGKEQVSVGRAMHWIRVDRYFDQEQMLFQPVPCMHCEKAPCELVCPTAATVHSNDGLNQMVYNRCVGTRYCSNNCPYKVRRFNFFHYTTPGLEKLGPNPQVTLRTRGVMEKCTYCIQRIEAARIDSEVNERPIKDGDVKTACQTACPTRAIFFGNLLDPNAEVTRLKREPHEYTLLEETGARPRTTYLARIRQENPA